MSGMSDLVSILAHYTAAGKRVILKSHFVSIINAILAPLPRAALPSVVYVDATAVKVAATSDSPAIIMMSGFPNILNLEETITADLSDGGSREISADVTMSFSAGDLWGSEKASQWYAVLAKALDSDTDFALKSMPYLRVKSQAGQIISLGSNGAPATGIGYGWDTDSLADGSKLYFLSGASKGIVRTVLHNNNDNATGGTIEYSGAALTVAEGDWFVVLPATNFRWIFDVFNNSSSNLMIHGSLFGNPNIVREPVTSVASKTISGLEPGRHYQLKVRVMQVGSNGRYDLNFNADSGANYGGEDVMGLTAVVSSSGGSGLGRVDISPSGGGNEVRAGEGFNAILDIFTQFDDPTRVIVLGKSGSYTNAGSWALKDIYGYYDGANPLTSLVVGTSAGTMTGELTLEKIG